MGKRGIYSRPSAAIERGSGFFIPGLEGGRVRIVFGLVLIIANVVNNNIGTAATSAVNVEYGITEWIGIIFSIIIISQGIFEGMEENSTTNDSESSSSSSSIDSSNNKIEVIQNFNPSLSSILINELRWVGLNIFSFTGTTKFLIWDNTDSLCFTLTTASSSSSSLVDNNDMDESVIQESIISARKSLSTSSTGTISVPNTHPVSNIINGSSSSNIDNNNNNNQGIILQRIHYDNSWGMILVTDKSIQQAYTKNDFRWLPALANFIDSFI